MALFGLGKKKDEAGGNLSAQIATMRQQGYPDDQIIQTLQNQGHKSSEIYDAISQADMAGTPGTPGASGTPGAPGAFAPEQPPSGPGPAPMQPTGQHAQPELAPPPEPMQQSAPEDKERIEQIAEAIIDEKWQDLIKDINKITELNKKTESRLVKVEADIKNLKENFDSLHKGVLGKITEYDQNLVNVGTEIKAMEKVFQKILPTFTENVNKLSRISGGRTSAKKK